jgi:hypothetical protein
MELSEYDQSKSKHYRKVNIRSVRFEKIIPLFTGLLGSLVFCAVIAAQTNVFGGVTAGNYIGSIVELRPENTGSYFLTVREQAEDPVLEYYRNPDYQEWVIDFFTGICSSREIAKAVLQNADEFNISPALAFALSWEESRFNPRAVNRHNRDGSIDRGLFQLNNRSFPHLELNTFFDININTRYGISHLRHCLNVGGTEVSALAMYNAGTGRVNTSGAPRVTLNYIDRILENRSKIETRFRTMLIKEEEARIAEKTRNASQQLLQFNRTLISASPLYSSL